MRRFLNAKISENARVFGVGLGLKGRAGRLGWVPACPAHQFMRLVISGMSRSSRTFFRRGECGRSHGRCARGGDR